MSVEVGDSRETTLVAELHRGQIVQYAGASGDFNPLHTDEIFATESFGYPAVIGHGMLTMGLAGRLVTDWFGAGNIVSYGARLRSPVRPGDTLTGRAVVREVSLRNGETVATIDLATTNQRGETVLTGEAVARRSGAGA